MNERAGGAPSDIAVVGTACLLPKSPDVRALWRNIVEGRDTIEVVPDERWSAAEHFRADPADLDHVYSKWGCFLDDVRFDPARYGIPPISLRSIDSIQLLALEVSRKALADAAAHGSHFPSERTAVVFGTCGSTDLQSAYVFRTMLRRYISRVQGISEEVRGHVLASLESEVPQWTEDSFPGTLNSVIAGRVANRLDLGGGNFTVDAACASGLAAIDIGMMKLRAGLVDVALVGAAEGANNILGFTAFARTQALSPRGTCRPFDEGADGIVLGEGVAAVVLKRLEDAQRDGNRIHAIVKGIGSSSDGRHRSLVAPHGEGQARAVAAAYADAGVDPSTVELVEAHATGTALGDRTEINSLVGVFGAGKPGGAGCAIGSIKSMIGHTKGVAGIAGLMKGILALQQRMLPPTLGVETPNPHVDWASSPIYINTESRPWFRNEAGTPRRCGVSAFGFGGTNFHAVLEEYPSADAARPDLGPRPVEPIVLVASSRRAVASAARSLRERIEHPDTLDVARLAAALNAKASRAGGTDAAGACRLVVLVATGAELHERLGRALDALAQPGRVPEMRHIFYGEGEEASGRVCFLFPGQGSQRVNMLRDLVAFLPEHRGVVERADGLLADRTPQPLSQLLYPRPVFSDAEREAQQAALNDTRVAQPALAVAELVAGGVLESFGIRPHFVAGHSFGEYVALCAAGAISEADLVRLAEVRGRLVAESSAGTPGTMVLVSAAADEVMDAVDRLGLALELANVNAPDQTVLGGSLEAADVGVRVLREAGYAAQRIPVTAAFHTAAMDEAAAALEAHLARVEIAAPRFEVFSNTLADRYPTTPDEIRALLAAHIREPVRFADEVERLYDAGARVFFEVGPGTTLTNLVTRTLGDRPHTTLALDVAGRPGLLQLAHLLGRAVSLGLPVDLTRWFAGRHDDLVGVDEELEAARRRAEPASTSWCVNTGWARPPEGLFESLSTNERPNAPGEIARETGSRGDLRGVLTELVDSMREQQELTRRSLAVQEQTLAALRSSARPSGTQARAPDPIELPARRVRPSRPAPAAHRAPAPADGTSPAETSDETFEAALLRAVTQRTGYPADMIDMDAHMEADLGIDSIKRMEILGTLRKFNHLLDDPEAGSLEVLAGLHTLGSVVAWYEKHTSEAPASGPAVPAGEPVLRYVTRAVPAPLGSSPGLFSLPTDRVVLLIGEVPGLTSGLQAELRARGHRVRTVVPGRRTRALGAERYEVAWSSEADVAELRELLGDGSDRVGAILNLTGAHAAQAAAEPAELSVGLFLLLKAFEADLRQSAREGDALVLNVTAMDGRFGLSGAGPLPPGVAGTLGIAKSVAREWPDVRVKCLDLSPALPPQLLVTQLVEELSAEDRLTEVGLTPPGRVTLGLVPARRDGAAAGGLELPPDAVLLVTGGALGITAEVVKALALRHRPRLVLVGRSPRPGAEPAATRPFEDKRALRAHLIETYRASDSVTTAAEIERELEAILKRRRLAANLAALEASGVKVEYHALDVRDDAAFGALIDDVYARLGRIDGVIHGAGVIADKRIGEKSLDSFRAVFDTKVAPALVLADRLRPASLEFLLFFSSVSGRFGTPGQCDYSAANEVLNKLANRLHRSWPDTHVAALLWGPWESGMVTAEIGRFLGAKGIHLIPNETGVSLCLDELARGRDEDAEVVLAARGEATDAVVLDEAPAVRS